MTNMICSGCGLYSLVYIDNELKRNCIFAMEGTHGLAILVLVEESKAEGRTIFEVVSGDVRIEHAAVPNSEKV